MRRIGVLRLFLLGLVSGLTSIQAADTSKKNHWILRERFLDRVDLNQCSGMLLKTVQSIQGNLRLLWSQTEKSILTEAQHFALHAMLQRQVISSEQASFYQNQTDALDPMQITLIEAWDGDTIPDTRIATLRIVSRQKVTQVDPHMYKPIAWEPDPLPWEKEFSTWGDRSTVLQRSHFAWEFGRAAIASESEVHLPELVFAAAEVIQQELLELGGQLSDAGVFAHSTRAANTRLYIKDFGFQIVGTPSAGHTLLWVSLEELLKRKASHKRAHSNFLNYENKTNIIPASLFEKTQGVDLFQLADPLPFYQKQEVGIVIDRSQIESHQGPGSFDRNAVLTNTWQEQEFQKIIQRIHLEETKKGLQSTLDPGENSALIARIGEVFLLNPDDFGEYFLSLYEYYQRHRPGIFEKTRFYVYHQLSLGFTPQLIRFGFRYVPAPQLIFFSSHDAYHLVHMHGADLLRKIELIRKNPRQSHLHSNPVKAYHFLKSMY